MWIQLPGDRVAHAAPSSELSVQSFVPSHKNSLFIHSPLSHCHWLTPHGSGGLDVVAFNFEICKVRNRYSIYKISCVLSVDRAADADIQNSLRNAPFRKSPFKYCAAGYCMR